MQETQPPIDTQQSEEEEIYEHYLPNRFTSLNNKYTIYDRSQFSPFKSPKMKRMRYKDEDREYDKSLQNSPLREERLPLPQKNILNMTFCYKSFRDNQKRQSTPLVFQQPQTIIKKRLAFKHVFNPTSQEPSIEGSLQLQNGLVIKTLQKKSIFTNVTLANTDETNTPYTSFNGRFNQKLGKIVKQSFSRPQSVDKRPHNSNFVRILNLNQDTDKNVDSLGQEGSSSFRDTKLYFYKGDNTQKKNYLQDKSRPFTAKLDSNSLDRVRQVSDSNDSSQYVQKSQPKLKESTQNLLNSLKLKFNSQLLLKLNNENLKYNQNRRNSQKVFYLPAGLIKSNNLSLNESHRGQIMKGSTIRNSKNIESKSLITQSSKKNKVSINQFIFQGSQLQKQIREIPPQLLEDNSVWTEKRRIN